MDILIVFLIVFLVLSCLKVPLAHAMLGGALVGLVMASKSLNMAPSTAYSSVDVFTYLAIPGFIFAGDLMLHGKIAETILDEINKVGGKVKSVLGSFAVILSMLFGTILGSSTATVGLVGGMLIPKMSDYGYRREESGALIAASGILGILIPPSIQGITYAMATGQSILDVWISTVPIAFIIGPLFILINHIRCKTRLDAPAVNMEASVEKNVELKNKDNKFSMKSIPAFIAPLIIFVGVFGGIFTPTEASAVIVVYSLIVGIFVYKGLNSKNLYPLALKAAKSSAAIIILIAFASVAGRMFTVTRLPSALVDVIKGTNMSKNMFLLLLNIILIVVGMFMETNTAILILAPLLMPIADMYGINLIHLGTIMLFNLQIGMLTPPFAANVFVAVKTADVPFNKILGPLVPYVLVCIPVLILVTYVPWLSLFLVNLF